MSSSITISPEHSRLGDTRCVAFNADASVFAVGTTDGLLVYSADPCVLLRKHTFSGGVRDIALWGQSNVLAIVPGRQRQRVWLWDDTVVDPRATEEIVDAEEIPTGLASERRAAAASPHAAPDSPPPESDTPLNVVAQVDLESMVTAVRLHRRCIVAASTTNVYLFDASLRRVALFEVDPTASRALALQALDTGMDVTLAVPSAAIGNVQFVCFHDKPPMPAPAQTTAALTPEEHMRQMRRAAAAQESYRLVESQPHERSIAVLALTHDGAYAVTASTKGTVLKLVETKSGEVMRQFNRGTTSNRIHSAGFNGAGTLVACVSQTGTVHVFNSGFVPSRSSAGGAMAAGATNTKFAANPQSYARSVAKTVGDTVVAGGMESHRVQQFVAFAEGEYAFATYHIETSDSADQRAVYEASLVALQPGIVKGRAGLLVAQADTGRLLRVAVEIAEDGASQARRCALVWSARFPEREL